MKRFILFIMLCVALCTSCKHKDLIANDPSGGTIYFFQLQDDSFLNKVLVNTSGVIGHHYVYGTKYKISLCPKITPETPIFGEGVSNANTSYLIGEDYTIDELVSADSRFVALKDGYYLCYPYACIEQYAQFLDVEWREFYSVDPDTVHIYDATTPYRKRFCIKEKALVKLTGKSTLHFQGRSKEQITIEDVIQALNTIIENGEIEKYCHSTYSKSLL